MVGKHFARILWIAVAAVVSFGAAAFAAPPEQPCIAPGKNIRITWPGASALGARLYFRSENAKTEHYVQMRRTAGRFAAVLPKPENASSITYRIATPLPDGRYATRSSGTLAVRDECVASALSAEDSVFASALVIGQAEEGPTVPVGFGCDGIIGRITPAGELSAYDACTAQAIAGLGVTRSSFPNRRPDPQMRPDLEAAPLGVGVITPDHHRRPRRAPIPPPAPSPRLVEPVSPSRP
jgi:hypothetical protein